ncbi:hypothetical protein F1715_11395, partial [Streptococcus pneumoniae]|uniref:lipid-A-disaccharide synthase N-terminal domain-containing protein n=1 Tax=Streptococcus pneumoniae TaxID=1313 RepID=UPI00122F9CBB
MNAEMLWLGLGFLGQSLFSMRFLVQWWASERRKRSVVPLAFWYFSLAGGAALLAYAVYRADPVFHYGIGNRLWVGIVDVLGVLWLKRRYRRADIEEG